MQAQLIHTWTKDFAWKAVRIGIKRLAEGAVN
jgi:hypothetical protein